MSELLYLICNGLILEIIFDCLKVNVIDVKISFEMGEVFLNFCDDL